MNGKAREEGEKMELSKEYILSQYQELGLLNENENVRIVRNSINGRIAVKKYMNIEQTAIYAFLKSHRSDFIPQIYEYIEDGRQLIVIEEYIEGRNLEDILREQKLTIEESVCIVKRICRALYPLHMAGPSIVCRDLKPENIMITLQNHVKIIDFDIARIVSPGKNRDTVVMGTEGFAAPEQFGRRQTDCRSDIYALGTILNYMILRKFPVEEIAGGQLGAVIRRCVFVNPDERFQNVEELERALETLYPSVVRKETDKPAGDKQPKWRRILPPGFRSGTPWKMLVAVIGYLLMFNLFLSMEIREEDVLLTGWRAWFQKILFLLSQLAEIGFLFNYMGCRDRVSLLNSKNILLRVAGYVVLDFAFITIAALLWMFLEILI